MDTISRRLAFFIFATVSLLLMGLAELPPVSPLYHAFADGPTLFEISNFWNVISNVPFLLVALYGLGLCVCAGLLSIPGNGL